MNRVSINRKIAVLALSIMLAACGGLGKKSEEELAALAAGEYEYTAMYYSNADDAVIYHYYASKDDFDDSNSSTFEHPPKSEKKGTLTVKANGTKLTVTTGDGLSFTTSAIVKDDVMINPSNSFDFTIPAQQSGESEIESFVYSSSNYQGSFYGWDGEEELEFGLKITSGGNTQYVRFIAYMK